MQLPTDIPLRTKLLTQGYLWKLITMVGFLEERMLRDLRGLCNGMNRSDIIVLLLMLRTYLNSFGKPLLGFLWLCKLFRKGHLLFNRKCCILIQSKPEKGFFFKWQTPSFNEAWSVYRCFLTSSNLVAPGSWDSHKAGANTPVLCFKSVAHLKGQANMVCGLVQSCWRV